MFEAVNIANEITPSVLAVVVSLGVKPKDFAKVLSNGDALSAYRAELSKYIQDLLIAQAVVSEKEKEDGKSI